MKKVAMKKVAMVVICAMALSGLAFGSLANATVANPGWFNVSVQNCNALPASGFYSMVCTSTDTPAAWAGTRIFLIDATVPAQANPMLASVLTGYSTSGACALYLPNTQAQFTAVSGAGVGTVP